MKSHLSEAALMILMLAMFPASDYAVLKIHAQTRAVPARSADAQQRIDAQTNSIKAKIAAAKGGLPVQAPTNYPAQVVIDTETVISLIQEIRELRRQVSNMQEEINILKKKK